MDAVTLQDAMADPNCGTVMDLAAYARLVEPFNTALQHANCTTVDRVAMFCAQLGAESGGLRWMTELADGSEYDWRSDLGNTQPGDGPRFKGRGPIQVTGRHNYGQLSQWAHAHGYVATSSYFLDHPEHLAWDRYAFLGAVWYWTVARDMNSYADRGDIYGATVAVNGGTNNLLGRTQRWNRVRPMGSRILPPIGSAEPVTTNLRELIMYRIARTVAVHALRAAVLGGDHGFFTHERFPALVPPKGQGLGHRIAALEAAASRPAHVASR